jgi:hypothetical protein
VVLYERSAESVLSFIGMFSYAVRKAPKWVELEESHAEKSETTDVVLTIPHNWCKLANMGDCFSA